MYFNFPAISPVIFSIGPFALRWYAMAYLTSIVITWVLLGKTIKKYNISITAVQLDDLVFYATMGIILGGRLGYVLFYGNGYFLHNPLEILAVWNGGMSFHGGIIGVIIGLWLFTRKAKLPYLQVTDLVSLYVPIGIFLGRLANFVNDELWGRITTVPWAVKFPAGGYLPRHPSQLYEAASEGIILFVILNLLWRKTYVREHVGIISATFLICYAFSRMCMELFREPDVQIGYLSGGITLGQYLSLPFLLLGLFILHKSIQNRTR